MTPESDIKISLTRINRIDSQGQVVQWKEQINFFQLNNYLNQEDFPGDWPNQFLPTIQISSKI